MNPQAVLVRRLSAMAVPSGAALVCSSAPGRIAKAGGRIARPAASVRGFCGVRASVARDDVHNGGVTAVRTGRGDDYLPPRFRWPFDKRKVDVQNSVAPMMDWTDNHYRTLARLISKHAWLYTEMVVAETIIHQQDNLDKFLKFPEAQHPIVLQLGGSNPEKLLKASRLASSYEYDEINLNCGCPSEKVAGHGCFGASLMLEPGLVGECMTAIAEGSPGTPVTVKCRIGVDDFDSYDLLHKFVSTVSSTSPTQHFIIHARKAILKGLSPAANRTIPPLKYEFVYALIRDFPNLKFTLNGGVISTQQVNEALQLGVFGVMLGRAAYNVPWQTLGSVDKIIYGDSSPRLTRRQILERYVEYADAELHKYGQKKPSVRHVVKPLLGLFHAESGAGVWRRAVDDSLRRSETVRALLEETLPVIPDFILDSPPFFKTSTDTLLANLGPLPFPPAFSSINSFQGLAWDPYLGEVTANEKVEEPPQYVPAPPIPADEIRIREKVELVLYNLERILPGQLDNDKADALCSMLSAMVEVQNPAVCFRGSNRCSEWLKVLIQMKASVNLHEVYYENDTKDPDKRWVYAVWTLGFSENINTNSSELGESMSAPEAAQLSGETVLEMERSGLVSRISSTWYILQEDDGAFAKAKDSLLRLLGRTF